MVAGCRVLHSSATGSARPQRLRASPPRQDQNHRASGSESPGFVPNPRDKGSRAIRGRAQWKLGHDDDLSKPATPNQFGKGRAMQTAQEVTMKSGQQNASWVDSKSPMHSEGKS